MNTKYFCIFKRIIAFILIFLISFNITNYAYAADFSTIGSLALDTVEVITDSYKAEIIDFAKAAGYEANAQYISTKLSSNLCKSITNSLGSIIIAIITGANMGMRSAYNEMDYEFKKMFSYEECLQFIWKKAMGANDETLLRFLHTAMDPENVQGIADKSLSFKYDYALSVAVANAVYDGYFEANPAYDSNIVMDYYGPNPFVYTNVNLQANKWYISDSYFEPEAYLKAIENYLRFNEPNFNIDFMVIENYMFLKYDENSTYPEMTDYHVMTGVSVYDFPDSYTPIFLYNPSTNSANLTVYEDPKYNDTNYWYGKRRSYFVTDYPVSDALFFDYGMYFREDSSSNYSNISASTFKSSLIGNWYYIDDNGEQKTTTFNLSSFGHFCNHTTNPSRSIYKLPVYIMQDNILYPYDLKAERIINKPIMIYKPSIENALYNNMIPDNKGKIQNINVNDPDPYIDTNGDIVPVGEAVSIEPGVNPDPGGGNSGGSSDDFSNDAGSEGKFFFPNFPDFKGLLTIPNEAASSFSNFAVFLSNSFSVLPDSLQSIFWWALVFCLAVSLIVILL